MVGTIDQKRMLTLLTYDARGNKTAEQKMGRAVAAGVDLSTLTGDHAALFNLVGDHADDQVTLFVYDGANRLTAQREAQGSISRSTAGFVLGLGGVVAELSYGYDALGNRTYSRDANGNVTRSQFDSKGRLIKTINVDGSGTVARYDAEGNRTFVYTGEMPNQAVLPNNITAGQGDGIQVGWNLPTGSLGRTWVVYDSQSRSDIDTYANRAGEQLATLGAHFAQFAKPAAGSKVYFRVVSQDVAGNLVWSEEKVLTVAPQYDRIEIYETGNGGLRFRVHFEGEVNNASIKWGGTNTVALTATGGGYYQGELAAAGNLSLFSYTVNWQDASGKQQVGLAQTLTTASRRTTPSTTVYHQVLNPQVSDSSAYQYKLVLKAAFDAGQTSDMQLMLADWRPAGAGGMPRTSSVVARQEGGRTVYDLFIGDPAEPLAVGDYDIVLRGMRADGVVVELDRFRYTLTALPKPAEGADASKPIVSSPSSIQHASWRNPHEGFSGQWVVLDGKLQQVSQQGEATILDGATISNGAHNLDVFYTQTIAQTRTVNAVSSQATHIEQRDQSIGFKLDVNVGVPTDKVTQTAGGVFIAYGRFGGTAPTDPNAAGYTRMTLNNSGGRFLGTATGLAKDVYSYIVYGKDANGVVTVLQASSVNVSGGSNSNSSGADVRFTHAEQFIKVDVEVPTPDTYNLSYTFTLSNEELANLQGDFKVRYLKQGESVAKEAVLVRNGNQFTVKVKDLKGLHELKAYYTDNLGRTVIADWRNHDPKTGFADTANSTVIVAKEQGIQLNKDGNGLHSYAGVYLGPQKGAPRALDISVIATGLEGGQRASDGRNTGYYVETKYDAMGHKIGSTETDGIWREYGVDQAGNAVLTSLFDKLGGTWQANSFAEYDGRGRKVAEWSAAFTASSDANDVTGYAQRNLTRYRYHRNDQVADQVSIYRDVGGNVFDDVLDPRTAIRQRAIYDATGQKVASVDALGKTTHYQYDEAGRLVGTIDARSFRSQQRYDHLGNLVEEVNGAGGFSRYEYDTLGRRIVNVDGVGNRTSLVYNRRNHLLQQGDTAFTYDLNGNRISSQVGTYKVVQDYDSMNRIVASHTWHGGREHVERRQYDVYGNLILEVDAAGRTKSYRYGAFNRLLQSADEGGLITHFEYDGLGRQTREYNAEGKDVRRAWHAAGQLASVTDVGVGGSTVYRYDDAGRRLREQFNGQGHSRDLRYEYDAQGRQIAWRDTVTNVASRTELDASGNVVRVWNDGVGQAFDHRYEFDGANRVAREGHADGRLIHAYRYDAAGNRIEDNDGTRVTHYVYDSKNRVVAARWYGSAAAQASSAGFGDLAALDMLGIRDRSSDAVTLPAGNISLTVQSGQRPTLRSLAIDYLGDGSLWNRIAIVSGGDGGPDTILSEGTVVRFNRTLRDVSRAHYGNEAGWTELAKANGLTDPDAGLPDGTQLRAPHLWQMTWEYDANGNVVANNQGFGWYHAKRSISQYTEGNRKTYSEEQSLVKIRYATLRNRDNGDGGGRFFNFFIWHEGFALGTQQSTSMSFDASGRMTNMQLKAWSDHKFAGAAFENGGAKQFMKQAPNGMGADIKDYFYNYSYTADGRASSITGSGPKRANGSSSFQYNANRQLVRQVQGQGDGMERSEVSTFSYDHDGHIVYKWHDGGRKDTQVETIHYLYANGQSVGETGHYADGSNKTLIDDGRFARIDNIDREFPSSSIGSYTAKGGENLRQVAANVWGNAALWYLIADANGLNSDTELQAGQRITIPNHSRSDAVTSDTFRVYREDEIIGSQTPNLKTPPPKKKCGGFGAILMIVVAVVVTVFTAGAGAMLLAGQAVTFAGAMSAGVGVLAGATASLGGLALAAGAAAAGSVASQLVGMATGDVEKFSWKQVGVAAVTAGVTAGVGMLGAGSAMANFMGVQGTWAGQAVAAMTNTAITQASLSAAGAGTFRWKSVAAAGLVSAAGSAVDALGSSYFGIAANDGSFGYYAKEFAKRGVQQTIQARANGASMRDAWKTGLANSFASVAANAIGDHTDTVVKNGQTGEYELKAGFFGEEGSVGHVLAHSVLGATVAKLRKQDAWAGAIGGAASAWSAGWLADQMRDMGLSGPAQEKLLSPLTQMIGAGTAEIFGHDASNAAGAAANATENNFLPHSLQRRLQEAYKRLEKNARDLDAAQTVLSLTNLDRKSDQLLARRKKGEQISAGENKILDDYLQMYRYENGESAFQALTTYGPLHRMEPSPKPTLWDHLKGTSYNSSYARSAWNWVKSWDDEDPRSREQKLNERAFQTFVRETSANAQIERAGEPAIYFLSGGLGAAVRFAGVAMSAYQMGEGIGQIRDGEYGSGALNVAVGGLGIWGNFSMQRGMSSTVKVTPKVNSGASIGGAFEGRTLISMNIERQVALELGQELADDAAKIIASSSKGELGRLAATAKAAVAETSLVSSRFENIYVKTPNFPGVKVADDNLSFVITDKKKYLDEVAKLYAERGSGLSPAVERMIKKHIESKVDFPTHAGLPGLHAEVRAVNDVMNKLTVRGFNPMEFDVSKIQVSTFKLAPDKVGGQGQPFLACSNCGSILPRELKVNTGRKF
ncbi:YwqJ-related putative deaminase [Chitinivorax sp. B]|uniref:YwqJ-related putative deaminase n=1 Tax=Chitinivorax sp. B TaxID=2502235 RepID=UPI001BB1DD3A|nr:YwqJ-related putative deaminase [Chitinivorax sp. B]